MPASASIYVEIDVRCGVEELWKRSQTPDLHARWDLRFSRIAYLPLEGDAAPQRFTYERSVLPGVVVRGWGETRGERRRADDSAASALRFGSAQRRSLIREGSGYWRYVPLPDGGGVRFLTRYDYTPRWGAAGRALDTVLFRRLIGWATAWSFDRLRLWIEEGVEPERGWRRARARRCRRSPAPL